MGHGPTSSNGEVADLFQLCAASLQLPMDFSVFKCLTESKIRTLCNNICLLYDYIEESDSQSSCLYFLYLCVHCCQIELTFIFSTSFEGREIDDSSLELMLGTLVSLVAVICSTRVQIRDTFVISSSSFQPQISSS